MMNKNNIWIRFLLFMTFALLLNSSTMGGDKGGDPTPSPCDLCPDDYNLVATYQDVIKTKEGTIPGEIYGVWEGTAKINGVFNGHSCHVILPDIHMGDPASYTEDPDNPDEFDPPEIEASHETDVDYCIKGNPGTNDFNAVALDVSYLYQWNYRGGVTEWLSISRYNPPAFTVLRNSSIVTQTVSVTINDILMNGQDICDSVADDGIKSSNHTFVVFRQLYSPKVPHGEFMPNVNDCTFEYVHQEQVEPYGDGELYEKRIVDDWEVKYCWGTASFPSNFNNSTGCGSNQQGVSFISIYNLVETTEISQGIAIEFFGVLSIGAYYQFSETSIYNYGHIVTLNPESEYINTTFVPIQELFQGKYDHKEGIYEKSTGTLVQMITTQHKETLGGGEYIEFMRIRSCCQ
ncbi:hypothetical protein JW926_04320 [Candidatus Sumerlaeota bacterium]|nr:hypothetical protein [Candidatus Sumerlaeota bacterium]